MQKYDLIIIGGGPAGYNAAEYASRMGMPTLLIEQNELGGVCLNEGCIPTKTLLNASKFIRQINSSLHFGVRTNLLEVEHQAIIKRKESVIGTLRQGITGALKKQNVHIANGRARIVESTNGKLLVNCNETVFSGRNVLICTGSEAIIPPIEGATDNIRKGYLLTSKEILSIPEQPQKLIIIGAGIIGLEFASYFRALGCEVIILDALDHIAGDTDREISKILQQRLTEQGVEFFLSSKVIKINDGSISVARANGDVEIIQSNRALISVGRRPNTSELGLESIGVVMKGNAIMTDAAMRTSVPGVYAAGDVNGISMLAHTAYREGEVAVNNICGISDEMDYQFIPSVIYTDPEVASVGETLSSAQAKGIDAYEITLPMQHSGRYFVEHNMERGLCKILISREGDFIIGAHVISNTSSEFILAAEIMIRQRMTVAEIRKVIFPHPSICEIFRECMKYAELRWYK